MATRVAGGTQTGRSATVADDTKNGLLTNLSQMLSFTFYRLPIYHRRPKKSPSQASAQDTSLTEQPSSLAHAARS